MILDISNRKIPFNNIKRIIVALNLTPQNVADIVCPVISCKRCLPFDMTPTLCRQYPGACSADVHSCVVGQALIRLIKPDKLFSERD